MKRSVEPELLDTLMPEEPSAAGSRQDLRRLNTWMGNAALVARALSSAFPEGASRLVEIGAGDGNLLLHVARSLGPDWRGTSAALLDRQNIVSPATRHAFERLGWRTEVLKADVFAWLREPVAQPCEAIVANLFLHHFSQDQLAELLEGAEKRTRAFIAVEPRRSAWALALSRLIGLIGCNLVTRHDAPVSVRAGFAGQELSRLWPAHENWSLLEGPAGWCTHLFRAQWRS